MESSVGLATFRDLNLSKAVLSGIELAGFERPTPIQEQTIPLAMAGRDIIGLAQTGSGKTAAFALPALSKINFNKSIETLVLTPTRELAQQVAAEFERLGKPLGIKVVAIVGGQSMRRQIEQAHRGANIVVATPGRLTDFLRRKQLKRFAPHTVIFDEADEMLDMGFIDSIKEVIEYLPKERQTLMFSATMSKGVRNLAKAVLNEPEQISLTANKALHADIEQRLYVVNDRDREIALLRLIEVEAPSKALIFCRTKQSVDEVCERLIRRGVRTRSIHGDMTQSSRDTAMDSLKKGNTQFLVATDVASRGLDISDLSHVFNVHLPENRDRYTHRIGRTGRAGKKGIAVTICSPRELRDHHFFRQMRPSEFTILPVPRKQAALEAKAETLIRNIMSTDVTEEALDVCRDIYESEHGLDFMCRMYSLARGRDTVAGPDAIGYHPDDIDRLQSRRPRNNSAKFHARDRIRGKDKRRAPGGNRHGQKKRKPPHRHP